MDAERVMRASTKVALGFAIVGAALLFRAKGSALVTAIANAIPNGGVYKLDDSHSGTPLLVEHKGKIIAKKSDFVYCSGFTFAVVMEAAKRRGLLRDKSVEDVRRFKLAWYGARGDQERQQGPALEKLGIGRSIPMSATQPGDFVQLWRTNGTGHSVVFKSWIKDPKGEIIGLRYRSAQNSTGVADAAERFVGKGGNVNPARTYFSRLG